MNKKKKYYLVIKIETGLTVEIPTFPKPYKKEINFKDLKEKGLIGMLPLFDNYDNAANYASNNEEILTLENKSKEKGI